MRYLSIIAAISLIFSGCIVTTAGGPGTPPRAAVPEHATVRAAPSDKDRPTQIAAKHLLVQYAGAQSAPPKITRSKQDARLRAEEALGRARAGETFETLVAEYSDEPGAAARGGSLGKFQHHMMVKPFSDVAFALKIGQISDVVETPFGYHVIVRTE
jgi:NIMA-interacting peptidyl-prolyl cis-trans isomerase 1